MEILKNNYLMAESIPGRVNISPSRVEDNMVKYGDILFNRTSETPEEVGMTSVYLDIEPVVFGGFVIRAKPKGNDLVDSFKKYCFFSYQFRKEIIKRCQGVVRGNIGQGDLKLIPFVLPPVREQIVMSMVLDIWDKVIEKLTRKIELKKQIKKGLMQSLLSGKIRLPGFVGKWKTVELGELLDYEQPIKYIVSSTDYNSKHSIPVLTANKGFILGYTNELVGIYSKSLPVIIFDDFTTDNKFVDFKFKVKSSAIKILTPKSEKINIRFVYGKIKQIKFVIGQHRRHYLSEYQYITIDLPEVEEQNAIQNILTSSDQEIELLENKLQQIKQQKKYLLNNLITGIIRTPQYLV